MYLLHVIVFGTLAGAVTVFGCKLRGRINAFLVAFATLAFVPLLFIFLLRCPQINVAGINEPYADGLVIMILLHAVIDTIIFYYFPIGHKHLMLILEVVPAYAIVLQMFLSQFVVLMISHIFLLVLLAVERNLIHLVME